MTISSLGGIPDGDDEAPPDVSIRHISRREYLLVALQTVLRLGLGFLFILWMMSLVPDNPQDSVLYPTSVAVIGIVMYAFFFRRQLQGVYKSRYPTLRAIEALILTAAMFLAIFAMVYVMISLYDENAFSEVLDSFSAYYYALTVLATVGFGDIAPNTVPARAVSMLQMSLDIAFIAVLIRVMGGAAKKALVQRAEADRAEADRAEQGERQPGQQTQD